MSVLPPFALRRPGSLDEALAGLSFDDLPLAGGTELLLAMRMRLLRPASLVSLKRVPELAGIEIAGDRLQIGGAVTHQEAAEHPLVLERLPVLSRTLLHVGNPRVRASGTLAGNLVFAEPKSDVIPILLAFDATVELASAASTRELTIGELILGPYYSAREADELLTQIRIPLGRVRAAAYLKYQTMERPTVGVAAIDVESDGAMVRRIVIGAVAELPIVREFQPGERIDGGAIAAEIDVIPDIAGDSEYKRHVTGVYIDRAVKALTAAGQA